MGIVSADFDGDGWPDVYVGNDVQRTSCFTTRRMELSRRSGHIGTAYDQYGDAQGTMGSMSEISTATALRHPCHRLSDQVNTLYRNLGNLQFRMYRCQPARVPDRATGYLGVRLGSISTTMVCRKSSPPPAICRTPSSKYEQKHTYKQRSLLLQHAPDVHRCHAGERSPGQISRKQRGAVSVT